MSGRLMARRRTTSRMASPSLRSLLRNLSRAGVAKNRSRTSTRVPSPSAPGFTAAFSPASTVIAQACGSPACRVVMVSRATAPIEGSASPRKPSVRMSSRSSSGSFEVAWRSTASARSSRVMPAPSSLTRISLRPPPSVTTSMRVAPASSAFSTSSLTTLAGRSTTSPAAMRLTMPSESWRTGICGPWASAAAAAIVADL